MSVNVITSFESNAEILTDETHLEAIAIVSAGRDVLKDSGARVVGVHAPAAASADRNDLRKGLRVDTEFLSQGNALSCANHCDTEDQVVADLCDLTGAGTSASEYVLAHAHENLLSGLELFLLTADHEGERACGGSSDTARHGGIDENEAILLGFSSELLGGCGEDG